MVVSEDFKRINFYEGKSYKTRKGEEIVVLRNNLPGTHPVLGMNSKKVLLKFNENGKHIGDGFSHDFDLVKG